MRTRWWMVAVTVLVILSGGVAATSTTGGPTATEATVGPTQTADEVNRSTADAQMSTDRVVLNVSVDAEGDATWEVQYWTELAGDSDRTAAFEDLQADVESNPGNYTDRFADRMRTTVRDAEEATGREMNASGFAVETEMVAVPCDCGIVTYTFEWSNFASVEGDRIEVGDAIEGFFLDDGSRLEVRWPEGWTAATVDPVPDSETGRSATWRGSTTDFGPGQPRVVIERGATPTPTPAPTDTGGDDPDGTPTGDDPGGTPGESPTPSPGGGGSGLPLALLAVLALVVAGVAAVWWRRPDGVALPGDGTALPGESPASPGIDGGEGTPTADAGGDADATGDGDAPIDEELLSNEERVLRLLEERGGRIKQQEVVEALDWTEAKTSQVVSGMREEDSIDGFRLGRENVLTLPDTDIEPGPADDEGDGE